MSPMTSHQSLAICPSERVRTLCVGAAVVNRAWTLIASQRWRSIDLRRTPLVRQAIWRTDPSLSCKQTVVLICTCNNVSVEMHYATSISLRRFVVTRTMTMATSGGRTPSLRVVSPFLLSTPSHEYTNGHRPCITWRRSFSVQWVQMNGSRSTL